jgi:hypothetical protein
MNWGPESVKHKARSVNTPEKSSFPNMMILPRKLRIQLGILSLLLILFVDRSDAQSCTLCFDGSNPNLDAMIGETSCSTIATAIQQTPADDPRCQQIQVQGFIYCGCPSLPDTVCSMCTVTQGVAYVPIAQEYRSLILPGSDGITCGAAEFPSLDSGLCDNITGYASFCGCSGASSRNDCFLCGPNTTTDDIGNMNRLLPPTFTTSCASLDRQLGTLEQCTDSALGNLTADIPISVLDYCGCPNSSNVTSACTNGLCGNVEGALKSNATVKIGNSTSITCLDLDMVRSYITDASYCETLSSEYASVCCNDQGNTPSAPAPTPATGPTANVPAPTESSGVLLPSIRYTVSFMATLNGLLAML